MHLKRHYLGVGSWIVSAPLNGQRRQISPSRAPVRQPRLAEGATYHEPVGASSDSDSSARPLPIEFPEMRSGIDRTLQAKPVNEIQCAGRPLVILVLEVCPKHERCEGSCVDPPDRNV